MPPHRTTRRLLPRALATAACVCALTAGAAARGADAPAVRRTLPNGLRVIARERRHAPLVAIDIWVGAGTGREAPAEAGAAHFVEHLLFRGTPTRPAGEVDEAIESLGAVLNAGTGRDGAHFFTTVPSDYWQTALEVMADAVRSASLRAEDIERERAVLLDEVAWDRTDMRRQAGTRLYAALFAGHPYAEPTGGRPDQLARLSAEAVAAFRNRLYVPGSVTVVVVGDASAADVEAAVDRAFGDWAGGGPPPAPPAPPADRPPRPAAADAPAAPARQPAVLAAGWSKPSAVTAQEAAVADVACALLNGPGSGRLPAAVTLPGFASRAWAEHTHLLGAAMVAFYVEPSGDAARALERAVACATRLAEETPGAAEMAAARRRALAAWMRDTETFGGQARVLGYHALAGPPGLVEGYEGAVAAVTADQVRAFARRWLAPERRVEVSVAPGDAP